jgi:hypothetical protein
MILELSESCGTADIEAPQTARAVTDNMWMRWLKPERS